MKNKSLINILGICSVMLMLGVVSSFAAMQYQETYTSSTGKNKVLLLVNSAIYDAIYSPSLKQYISDLEAEDYNVTVTKYISGSPAELKSYMKLFSILKGVVFIGDLPIVMSELSYDSLSHNYSSFPNDLFYTDLNGEWSDTDNNGIYDVHNKGSGNLLPEIWLGRLTASPIYNKDMDEIILLKNYFAKNHAYRTGKFSVLQGGLVYLDDDFRGYGILGLDNLYDNVTLRNDPLITTAEDYRNSLKRNYELIAVYGHSSWECQAFYNDQLSLYERVNNTDIRDIDPTVLFYVFNACSLARYDMSNYMAGHYIFTKTYGLAGIGSTKIMGYGPSFDFFSDLGSNVRSNLGEAFKRWFNWGSTTGSLLWRSMVYGMTLLGDPTLTIDPPIPSIDSINPPSVIKGSEVAFQGSGKINKGYIVAYSWRSSIDGYLSGNASFSTSLLSRGTHTIFLKVKDDKDRWSSEVEAKFTIPVATLNLVGVWNKDSGFAVNTGNKVFFIGSNSSNPYNGNLTYLWDFGNGVTSTLENPSYTYSSYGAYAVTLTVKDGKGNTDKTVLHMIVYPAGDANGDCSVNKLDTDLIGGTAWGKKYGDSGYDPGADLNNDGRINILDASLVGINWGKTCSY